MYMYMTPLELVLFNDCVRLFRNRLIILLRCVIYSEVPFTRLSLTLLKIHNVYNNNHVRMYSTVHVQYNDTCILTTIVIACYFINLSANSFLTTSATLSLSLVSLVAISLTLSISSSLCRNCDLNPIISPSYSVN